MLVDSLLKWYRVECMKIKTYKRRSKYTRLIKYMVGLEKRFTSYTGWEPHKKSAIKLG